MGGTGGQRHDGWLDRFPIARDAPVLAHLAALVIIAVGIAVRFVVADALPPGYPFVTLFPAVIISAFLFGLSPGLVAGVVGGAAAWHWWIPHGAPGAAVGAAFAMGFYTLVIGTDLVIIHWMQRATERARRQRAVSDRLAETRNLLFHELQHRVSNNLQVAAALLTLQKREVADGHARAALDDAAGRLGLIGRISRQLYGAEGDARSMSVFLESLARDVVAASGRDGVTCTVEVDDRVPLGTEAAVPIALVVAEAIANAIEHGFADRETGHVRIALHPGGRDGDAAHRLLVEDDGRGLPEGFEIRETNSLGLRIARMLAQQLGGELSLDGREGGGTRMVLAMPA